jgi:hypothetical protein
MCCADAGALIITDNTAAAPKNPILVILLLLIPTHHMGRRRAGLALRQQHSRHGPERRSRFGDQWRIHRRLIGEAPQVAPQAETQNIENNPMHSSYPYGFARFFQAILQH